VNGEHVVDSFAMASLVPPGLRWSTWALVRSSGNSVSILRPDARLVVVEPRAKRIAFLRTVVRELQLASTEVLRERADALDRGGFDVAASRHNISARGVAVGVGRTVAISVRRSG